MYHRFDSGLLPKESISNTLMHLVDHTAALSDHARLLEKVIARFVNQRNYICSIINIYSFSVFEIFVQYLKME